MRDATRIPRITNKLLALWSKNPDMRFFQLVEMLTSDLNGDKRDLFYAEDSEVEALLVRRTVREVPAAEWSRIWNLEILDHDGWREDSNLEEFLNKPITEEEFFDRASESTCTGDMSAFDKWKDKW